MRKAKKDFEKKLAKNAKKNSKVFWSYMKQKTANRVTVAPMQLLLMIRICVRCSINSTVQYSQEKT